MCRIAAPLLILIPLAPMIAQPLGYQSRAIEIPYGEIRDLLRPGVLIP